MKNIAIVLLLTGLTGFSCSSTLHKVFDNKTPHEEYAEVLDDKDLENTPEGRQWLSASEKALNDPQPVRLPYRQLGYFHADKARALGLQFNAKQGEKLIFTLTKKAGPDFIIYADLFKQEGSRTSHLLAADTSGSEFSIDIKESGIYVLRLQPQLYGAGEYGLSVSVGPSLGFPVSGTKARIGSFWGDGRDGGKRKHEGIDIFAPKRTPVIAAADGYITGVREGGIGGKTVWMKPADNNVYLYYAHLDEQLVQQGQSVKKGDVLGLVGNTGNARYTPSHLHFGVYTYNGAIDALPFVNRSVKTAPAPPSKNLKEYVKLVKTQKTDKGAWLNASTLMVPLAINSKGYIAELPDGQLVDLPFSSVKNSRQAVRSSGAVAALPPAASKGS
jgi:peptidoglycan LD-endopeptidase LytH